MLVFVWCLKIVNETEKYYTKRLFLHFLLVYGIADFFTIA